MADQLQLRGGTTTEHSTFTGALREVTVDTTKKTLVVHDAATAGGIPLARQDLNNVTLPAASTTAAGVVQLNDGTNSTSTTRAATANSVKTAFDAAGVALGVADAALPKSGGTMTGTITFAAGQTISGYVATTDTGVVTSSMIADGTITNTDINASAGIALSKLANVSATDKLLGRSSAGAGAIEEVTCTAAGRALIDDADAAAQRTTLGLGSASTMTGPTGSIVGTTDSQTLTNKTLTDPAIIGTILEDVYTISDGAAFEIDPGNGSIQLITLGANRTPKATNMLAGESVTLMVDDGTAYTLTWTDATFGGSGVVWKTNAGVAPTLNTTGYTVIVLWKVGTQVYGARVGDA